MTRRLRSGELLAVDPSAVGRHADGWLMLLGSPPPANRRVGSVVVVSIRDALEHHACPFSDSYEAIIARVGCALRGESETVDDEGIAAGPPSAVILDIDSPGGVVAGLNETVLTIRAMSKAANVPLVAYVNELAASAAYALCCTCEEVVCPESGIVGSVGVISTMVSQAEADKKMGVHVVLLTSGKRKSDGHAHAPITTDAVAAEKRRLDQSAESFFRLVNEARGISVKKIRALEAGIFQGADAVRIGLADEVIGLDEAIMALSESDSPTSSPSADGNETDRRALDVPRETGSKSTHRVKATPPQGDLAMSLKLKALIKKTEAQIAAAEGDPEKLVPLMMNLSAYKKTEKHIEHTKSEEDDDPEKDDDDEDDEDDEDEKKSKKAAAAKKEEEEAAASAAAAAKKAEEDDEEEATSAAAILALVQASVPGKKGKAMAGALAAKLDKASKYDALAERVSTIETKTRKTESETLIANAVATRRITKPQATLLAKKDIEFVRSYLEMHSKPLVTTDEDALHAPDANSPRTSSSAGVIDSETMSGIEQAVKGSGLTGDKAASLKQEMIVNAKKTLAELNGAGAVERF